MSGAGDASPRTAAILAKTRANAILRTSEEISKAMKVDKDWAADEARRAQAKVDYEKRHSERVAMRQQEVGICNRRPEARMRTASLMLVFPLLTPTNCLSAGGQGNRKPRAEPGRRGGG